MLYYFLSVRGVLVLSPFLLVSCSQEPQPEPEKSLHKSTLSCASPSSLGLVSDSVILGYDGSLSFVLEDGKFSGLQADPVVDEPPPTAVIDEPELTEDSEQLTESFESTPEKEVADVPREDQTWTPVSGLETFQEPIVEQNPSWEIRSSPPQLEDIGDCYGSLALAPSKIEVSISGPLIPIKNTSARDDCTQVERVFGTCKFSDLTENEIKVYLGSAFDELINFNDTCSSDCTLDDLGSKAFLDAGPPFFFLRSYLFESDSKDFCALVKGEEWLNLREDMFTGFDPTVFTDLGAKFSEYDSSWGKYYFQEKLLVVLNDDSLGVLDISTGNMETPSYFYRSGFLKNTQDSDDVGYNVRCVKIKPL